MIKLITLMLTFSISYKSVAQGLNKSELNFLYSTISIFILDHEKKTGYQERDSEFIFCLLNVDSNGKVEKIQLLADDKNKDSLFKYLNLLSPSIFKNKSFKNCKNKIIMIPFISFTYNRTSLYIKSLEEFYSRKTLSVISESDNIIVTSLFKYSNPIIIKENNPDIEKAIKIPDTEKQN